MYYVSFTSLAILFLCGSNRIVHGFTIIRSERDIFTNLQCSGNKCTESQCEIFGANCESDRNCNYCICNKSGMNTFIRNETDPAKGECKRDEDIVPESVLNESFRLEKTINRAKSNQCLTVAERKNDLISGKSCGLSLNMRWIWIKTKNIFQLMNVMSLQCLEFVEYESLCKSRNTNQTGQVAMKQCNKTAGQYIVRQDGILYTKLCNSKELYYLRLENTQTTEGHRAFIQRGKYDQWLDMHRSLHWKNLTFRGCYRFQNERFMLYLNRETCRDSSCLHQFSAPIFSVNKNCSIKWWNSKILYSNTASWQIVSGYKGKKLFSIQKRSDDTQILMVKQKVLEIFNGSLLKLAISCGKKMDPENQCLLLKFNSLPWNTSITVPARKMMIAPSTQKMTSSNASTTKKLAAEPRTQMMTVKTIQKMKTLPTTHKITTVPTKHNTTTVPTKHNMTTELTKNKMTTVPTKHNKTTLLTTHKMTITTTSLNTDAEKSSINPTAVAVPVSLLVVILIAGLFFFVCNQRQKRGQNLTSDQGEYPQSIIKNTEIPLNSLKPSTSDQPTQRISQQFEAPFEHPYEYVDKTAFTSPQTFPYEHASMDGLLRNGQRYEYPDQSQSHRYEYPSVKNKKPDITGDKDVCVEELGYSTLVRLPFNQNESENSGYTSLIKNQKGNEKVGNTTSKDEAEGLSWVDALDAHYTPLVRPLLKDNESENSCYTSLIKNKKQAIKLMPQQRAMMQMDCRTLTQ